MNIPMYLSVIVPVHNEERRVERCVESLIRELTPYKSEIIFVDNGSQDHTPEIVDLYCKVYPGVKAIHLRQRGKGVAVRQGMLLASGRYRYMCDVDLSTPANEIHRFIEYARRFDVVIGSRMIEPTQTKTTLRRQWMGRVFHSLVSDLVPGVRDTQCGFKMFRDYAAVTIFENVTTVGMAFDVEVLYLAQLMGYRLHEIAVPWTHDEDSRVRPLWDSLTMLWDVSQIKSIHTKNQRDLSSTP